MRRHLEIGSDFQIDIGGSASIAVLDARGVIIAINEAWKTFGRDNGYGDSAFGLGLNYITICRAAAKADEPGAAEILASLEDLLAGRTRIFSTEYPCHAPDEERWFQMIAMADSAGPEPHFLVMHMPITERKQAERRILEARREAEQAAAAKSRFLATAAHDLRQSVQAAMLFYQLLPEAPSEADSARLRLGQVLEGLQASLGGLTDVARLDAGVVEPESEIFAVDPMLERLWMEMAPAAEARGIDLRLVRTSAFAETDPALLSVILRNLLANAVTYARRGKVLLGCRRSGRMLRLWVCDTGPGIAEREQGLIFEEFYRGDHFGHDRSRGMGLGLSVVKRVAQVLGQRVRVRSHPGRGSVFEVTVPRACKQTQTAARADLPKVIQDTRLRGRLIAVIDDDANALNDLRMYYEFLGHEVLAAASGDAAVRQLRTQHRVPDAIVANRSLGRGDGDGGDAIRRIRDATGKPVPGILLTGEPVPDEALHCEGGVLLINKPAAPRELASALDAMLRD